MNRHEAYSIVCKVLEQFRELDIEEPRSRVGGRDSEEFVDSSGILYTADVAIEWTDSRESLIVRACIADKKPRQRLG